MRVEIRLSSPTMIDDHLSLFQWLRTERQLEGLVKQERQDLQEGQLGGGFELISVAIGSGGIATVLAGSLGTWLQNRSKVTIKVTHADRTIEVSATNIQNAQELIQQLLAEGNAPRSS
ncbi:effector-associated constant component EACC1 [Streptomyces sp. NPDC002386]